MTDVIVEGLWGIADGERGGHEDVGGLFADVEQVTHAEGFEDVVVHAADVAGDEAGIGLGDARGRLAGGVVDDVEGVDGGVGLAVTEDGDLEHIEPQSYFRQSLRSLRGKSL